MATGVLLPKQGLQMVEGKIVRWLRKPGDTVAEGDPLVEIETDKATIEIPAPVAGVLLALLRKEGETVPVAETIAVVGAPGENISSFTSSPTGPRAEAGAAPAGAPSGAGATAGHSRACGAGRSGQPPVRHPEGAHGCREGRSRPPRGGRVRS